MPTQPDPGDRATVTALSLTAVKGTRLVEVREIELEPLGVRGDRRFLVIDERHRMLNGKVLGDLLSVVAAFDADSRRLRLAFPDGRAAEGAVATAGPLEIRFFSEPRTVTLVDGPWAAALSEHVGRPVRLVEVAGGVDRGAAGAVSMISRASLARIAAEAGVDAVDARRFRMLIEFDGVSAHGEDAWIGRRVRVGGAVVEPGGHVGRCLVTSRDPESGRIDLPTLDLIRGYRGEIESTEPVPFGIHGRVVQPGRVRVGDPVTVDLGDCRPRRRTPAPGR